VQSLREYADCAVAVVLGQGRMLSLHLIPPLSFRSSSIHHSVPLLALPESDDTLLPGHHPLPPTPSRTTLAAPRNALRASAQAPSSTPASSSSIAATSAHASSSSAPSPRQPPRVRPHLSLFDLPAAGNHESGPPVAQCAAVKPPRLPPALLTTPSPAVPELPQPAFAAAASRAATTAVTSVPTAGQPTSPHSSSLPALMPVATAVTAIPYAGSAATGATADVVLQPVSGEPPPTRCAWATPASPPGTPPASASPSLCDNSSISLPPLPGAELSTSLHGATPVSTDVAQAMGSTPANLARPAVVTIVASAPAASGVSGIGTPITPGVTYAVRPQGAGSADSPPAEHASFRHGALVASTDTETPPPPYGRCLANGVAVSAASAGGPHDAGKEEAEALVRAAVVEVEGPAGCSGGESAVSTPPPAVALSLLRNTLR